MSENLKVILERFIFDLKQLAKERDFTDMRIRNILIQAGFSESALKELGEEEYASLLRKKIYFIPK